MRVWVETEGCTIEWLVLHSPHASPLASRTYRRYRPLRGPLTTSSGPPIRRRVGPAGSVDGPFDLPSWPNGGRGHRFMSIRPSGLTTKQENFVLHYKGNGTEAARLAGYKGNDKTLGVVASENLAKPRVMAALQERRTREISTGIMTRQELQRMWSSIANDDNVSMPDRLAAYALMARSDGLFLERVEVNTLDLAERIRAGRERAK